MNSAPTPQRTERLLPPDEIAAIDAFRFQARMPSRAAAVRELLRRGLRLRLGSADRRGRSLRRRGRERRTTE
jgi:hypothetical protein